MINPIQKNYLFLLKCWYSTRLSKSPKLLTNHNFIYHFNDDLNVKFIIINKQFVEWIKQNFAIFYHHIFYHLSPWHYSFQYKCCKCTLELCPLNYHLFQVQLAPLHSMELYHNSYIFLAFSQLLSSIWDK